MEVLKKWARYILRSDLSEQRIKYSVLKRELNDILARYREEHDARIKFEYELRGLKNEVNHDDPLARALDNGRIRAARMTIDELRAELHKEQLKSQWYRSVAQTIFNKLRRKSSFDSYVQKYYGSWRDVLRS